MKSPSMNRPRLSLRRALLAVLIVSGCFMVAGRMRASDIAHRQTATGSGQNKPDANLGAGSPSELRDLIERYNVDRNSLTRSYPVATSQARAARLKAFYTEWRDRLIALEFDNLSQAARVDYLLLKEHLDYELKQLEIQQKQFTEIEPFVPFAKTIVALEETRRRMDPIDAAKTAALLNALIKEVGQLQRRIEAELKPARASGPIDGNSTLASGKGSDGAVKKPVVNRAVTTAGTLRSTLRQWYTFYNGYDPMFTWWAGEPYKQVDQSLQRYVTFLREKVLGLKPESSEPGAPLGELPAAVGPGPVGGRGGGPEGRGTRVQAEAGSSADIIGDPIGREALLVDLAHEMIPYTPEELIAIARKELAWCEAEMIKASRELGYGDDWQKALEHVKGLYVDPGKQPDLIRELALEAVEFIENRDLVTVPPLARDGWRMEMMTPERQLVNPFFLGGETITVSYPTNTMGHEQKMMSMRGNNIHFSRATVFHELIPGHHLQGFMTARYKPYRSLFGTPFWTEGWALYWEMLLWDMNFAKSAENRIGMLFWRMHRCARIMFSLGFHLGQMSPQECIDLLVKRVGHEPENAIGEVRRSFGGTYGPLYQVAYLLGGLQFYALHKELVGSGKMTNRAFHDSILKENRIPVEMVRAMLTNQTLARDFKSTWKFYSK